MKKLRKRRLVGLAACYLVAVAVWLLLSGFFLARERWLFAADMPPQELAVPDDFAVVSGLRYPDDWQGERWLVSTDSDPQLVLEFPEGQRVGRFVFKGTPVNRGIGEMVLYYTTRPGEDFSDRHKLWARQAQDGSWYFDLNGRTVNRLRFDPDGVGGVYWQVESIQLNAPKPLADYFLPDTLETAVLLLVPVLLWALFYEGWAFFQPFISSRRLESRWRKEEAAKKAGG